MVEKVKAKKAEKMPIIFRLNNNSSSCSILAVLIIAIPIFCGCGFSDPLWNKIDVQSFICSKEYAINNSFLAEDTDIQSEVILVCGVRNRTRMRVNAILRYEDIEGHSVDVNVRSPSFDPTEWTYYCEPIHLFSTNSLEKKIDVELRRVHLEAK